MDQFIVFFLGILTGTLTGTLPRLFHDWYTRQNDKRIIQKALLLETLYMHKSTLSLQLLQCLANWPNGPFRDLFYLRERKYSTDIYDMHMKKLDQLLAPDLALQVHYYYWNVKRLNQQAESLGSEPNDAKIASYLTTAIHTYQILFGVLDVLSNKRQAHLAIKQNIESMLTNDADASQLDEKIFRAYGYKTMAKNLQRERSVRQ